MKAITADKLKIGDVLYLGNKSTYVTNIYKHIKSGSIIPEAICIHTKDGDEFLLPSSYIVKIFSMERS
jgi:hypothetical protein